MTRNILMATAALALLTACNNDKAGGNAAAGTTASADVTAPAVQRPADGDWTKAVVKTSAGGYRMGNPDAKVALVEYAAFTCPHCREFEEEGMSPLLANYVKNGQVSFEFRPFALSKLDMPAAIIARCGGEQTVFGLSRALFAHQQDWIAKLQSLPPAELERLDALPPEQQIAALADKTGLIDWAAQNGLPRAKAQACLADQAAATELVEINSNAVSQYQLPGTPSFILNGKLVDVKPGGGSAWTQLEAALKAALS